MSAREKAIDRKTLDAMVEEATVDAYNESEQAAGLLCYLEENLALPFMTLVLGHEVRIERLEQTGNERIVAICRRGRQRQRIDLADLPLPMPRPHGAEWIAAYCHWLGELYR